MYDHRNHITNLFFWKWYSNFAKLTNQSHLFKKQLLSEKLWQHLFFYKMEAEVFPSYNFWTKIRDFVNNFFASVDPDFLAGDEKDFIENPEKFLRDTAYRYIDFWCQFLQLLRDFWSYYPRYNVPFDNIECIYLDIWSELPKAIDSLLCELLVRDVPLREERPFVIKSTSEMQVTKQSIPVLPGLFTAEVISSHIVEFLLGEDKTAEAVTLQIITFYLDARSEVKKECSSLLLAKGLIINDTSLMKCFLGEYIFKGVSNEGKRFFMANSDLNKKNLFKAHRDKQVEIWSNLPESRKQSVLQRTKKSLESMSERRAYLNSLTLEEKAERHRKFMEELEAEDHHCG